VEEGERLVAAMERRLEEAEALRAQYLDRPLEEPPLHAAAAHMAHAVAVQQGLLRELETQRSQCVLRAPFDGRVVEVRRRAGEVALERPGDGELRRAGEVVTAGDPVVAIAAEHPTEVVAYAPEGATAYRPGREVVLIAAGSDTRAVSRIAAVSPTVERVPERLWPPTGVASWGRPFVVPIPSGFKIGSGDAVTVIVR
jgi:multidrug efflux pump subunit AcrA (membrane-fusion protein)